jgi:hypothetical protein
MSEEGFVKPKAMSEALDRIGEIAEALLDFADDCPEEVNEAISDIIALARYKFDVLP